jgi:hypothetical protein
MLELRLQDSWQAVLNGVLAMSLVFERAPVPPIDPLVQELMKKECSRFPLWRLWRLMGCAVVSHRPCCHIYKSIPHLSMDGTVCTSTRIAGRYEVV